MGAAAGVPETHHITMELGQLAAPMMIGADDAAAFPVWAGPGVFVDGVEEKTGFIVDWQAGAVPVPDSKWPRYRVRFFASFRAAVPHVVYEVTYAYDPIASQGFVYLPGRGEEGFALNGSSINHGPAYEGKWFRARISLDRGREGTLGNSVTAETLELLAVTNHAGLLV